MSNRLKGKLRTFKYEEHPCAYKEPCPGHLEIKLGENKSFLFHFYINDVGRYVALSNTVGCQDFYGEGATWWMAANECMEKILKFRKEYKLPKHLKG
jgi:hypothetical protein